MHLVIHSGYEEGLGEVRRRYNTVLSSVHNVQSMRIQADPFKVHKISSMGEIWKRVKNVWGLLGRWWVGTGNKT